MGPIMHNEYQIRERLQRRRTELLHRQQRVVRDLARTNEPLSPDFADRAVQLENDEALEAIGRAATEEIKAIDAALLRLEGGLYGICQYCNRPIERRRLAAMPQATSCLGCSR